MSGPRAPSLATTRTSRTPLKFEEPFNPSQRKAYKNAGSYCSRACSYARIVKKSADKPIRDRYGRTNRSADKKWQAAVREKDNYTCQRCGVQQQYIHAHHVATRTRRPDLKHDVSNGKCLCNACHTWVHGHPIEAEKLGLLAEGDYERERRHVRAERISSALRRDDLIPDVLRLYGEGLYPDAIGRELGVSGGPVRRILREAGIPPNPSGPRRGRSDTDRRP